MWVHRAVANRGEKNIIQFYKIKCMYYCTTLFFNSPITVSSIIVNYGNAPYHNKEYDPTFFLEDIYIVIIYCLLLLLNHDEYSASRW